MSAGVCAGCLNQLLEEDYVSALGQEWHMECFRCSACDSALSSWYFEKDGLLFCQTDYWARYGEACQHCTQIITGPVMAAGDHRFHPECFCCELCNAFIGDGEAYALIERSKLYCGSCYERVMRPLARSSVARRHAIQLVELPPRASCGTHNNASASTSSNRCYPSTSSYVGPPPLLLASDPYKGLTIKQLLYAMQGKLAALARTILRATISLCLQITKYSVDVSCGLMALHIGDRILEINGTPVKDQPISQIEHLICYSDTVLQLTIEHDPESLSVKPPLRSQNMCTTATRSPVTLCDGSARNSTTFNNNNNNHIVRSIEDAIENSLLDPEKKPCNENLNCVTRDDIAMSGTTKDGDSVSSGAYTEDCSNKDQTGKCNGIVVKNGNIPQLPGVRERVFKKRGEENGQITSGTGAAGKSKHRWRGRAVGPNSSSSKHILPLTDKERSSSMSRLLDGSACSHEDSCEGGGVLCDLARTRSFRVDARPPPTVFRAADLLQGELLGSGFFGQVYKVTHRDTNEVMVLKQLYRVDEDAQKNFLKEVAVLRSLSHPNVLRFIGVLYKERRLHLVTEYVGGGTLRSLLDSARAPPWGERAGYARDIAAGLAYLHRMNIIHRDLNSHNCLVREDKTVIVADFGLARIVKRTGVSGSLERSQRGSARERKKRYTVVGNPYWMAPEMMTGNVYDEKVDVFSFGIVLCEIIGRVPADPDFLPRNSDFGLNQTLFRDKFCDGCPEHLYSLAFLCCNLNPDRRPPFEVMEVWLEALAIHLSVQRLPPQDLLRDILQYSGSPDFIETSDTSTASIKQDQTILETRPTVLCKSKSGDILDAEESSKVLDLSSMHETVRGLGPKCISASHLCLPNKPVVHGNNLSKSQNTLSSTPAGYILSRDDKTINITKVDDVREWLDKPVILRNGTRKENFPEKRQSIDNTIDETDFHSKARKISHRDPLTGSEFYKAVKVTPTKENELHFKIPDLNTVKVLKSKSHHSNTEFEKEEHSDLPSYLRNQSVEELESKAKIETATDEDVTQPFIRHYSIPVRTADDSSDSDSDDRIPISFKAMIGCDKKSYVVNPEESPVKTFKEVENGKRQSYVTDNIKLLQQRFESKNEIASSSADKSSASKGFNSFAKKLMSPKLGRKSMSKIFNSNPANKETKPEKSPKGKSTFFVTTPQCDSKTASATVNNVPLSPQSSRKPDNPSKCASPKVSHSKFSRVWHPEQTHKPTNEDSPKNHKSVGKCMTPLLRRHNRVEDPISSVGRFSYREKRSSPLKYSLPDRNALNKSSDRKSEDSNERDDIPKYDSSSKVPEERRVEQTPPISPLVRCGNFNNIPSLDKVVNKCTQDSNNADVNEHDSHFILNNVNGKINDTCGKSVLNSTEVETCVDDPMCGIEYRKKSFENTIKCFEKGMASDLNSTGNYVSLANLKINCPSLSRTRESLVKRNISKFEPGHGRNSLRGKLSQKNNDKCVTTPPPNATALESTAL